MMKVTVKTAPYAKQMLMCEMANGTIARVVQNPAIVVLCITHTSATIFLVLGDNSTANSYNSNCELPVSLLSPEEAVTITFSNPK